MTNPFWNAEEQRMRALWRIIMHFILMILLIVGFGAVDAALDLPDSVGRSTQGIAIALSVLLAARLFDNRGMAGLGLSIDKDWWKAWAFGVLAAFVVQAMMFGVQIGAGWITFKGFGWERGGSLDFLLEITWYFILMMAVGFYEEMLSRGYQLKNAMEGLSNTRIGVYGALLVSVGFTSSLFALLHASNPNVTQLALWNIVLAGVMLAVPYLISGSLAISVGIHFSWNFVMGGIFGLPVSGLMFRRSIIQVEIVEKNWLNGGDFGPEAGLIGIVGILLITGLTMVYLKNVQGRIAIDESFVKYERTITSGRLKSDD